MKYDDLARMMERHGGEWAEQVNMCGRCGELNAFMPNNEPCPLDCDGRLYPVAKYVDTFHADVPELIRLRERIEEIADELPGDYWRKRDELNEIAEDMQEAIDS